MDAADRPRLDAPTFVFEVVNHYFTHGQSLDADFMMHTCRMCLGDKVPEELDHAIRDLLEGFVAAAPPIRRVVELAADIESAIARAVSD